jgi:hypothetical protein
MQTGSSEATFKRSRFQATPLSDVYLYLYKYQRIIRRHPSYDTNLHI